MPLCQRLLCCSNFRGIRSISAYNSSDLGFVQFLKRVVKKTVGQTEERLLEAVVQAGEAIDSQPLSKILLHQDPGDRTIELEKLRSAIATSRQEYLLLLSNWLRENLPTDLEEVILCGGTSDYFKSALPDLFGKYRLVWHSNVDLPKQLVDMGYGHRFLDVWGLWQWWLSQVPLVKVPVIS